jgi:hypothetical protein
VTKKPLPSSTAVHEAGHVVVGATAFKGVPYLATVHPNSPEVLIALEIHGALPEERAQLVADSNGGCLWADREPHPSVKAPNETAITWSAMLVAGMRAASKLMATPLPLERWWQDRNRAVDRMKGVTVPGEELPACLAEPLDLADALLDASALWLRCLDIAHHLDDERTLDESMLRSLLFPYAP